LAIACRAETITFVFSEQWEENKTLTTFIMSSDTKSKDYLRVPKFNVSGTNWVVYKDRLKFAANARGYLHHINKTATAPVLALTTKPDPLNLDLVADKKYQEAVEKHKKEVAVWKKGEVVMKQLIALSIPDSLFMKVRGNVTAQLDGISQRL
ncbi:hypothetical protein EW026_g7694, partial [Hermanssonia centrifuga]